MNARTSLPLLVVMTLAAAPALAQSGGALAGGAIGGTLGGNQGVFDLVNQTAMLGGDYSAKDHMQMEQWYKDAEARGDTVLWNPDRSTWRELNGTMVPTQFGQIFGDTIAYTDGIRKQSTMPRPLTPEERAQAAKAVGDKRKAMLERHSSECAPGFVGPPSPGVDCEKFKDLTDKLAKLDPDALQKQDSENAQWGGNDKGRTDNKKSGDEAKSGGMGIMSAGSGGDGGERAGGDETPSPNPTRPPADETVAASGGGDTGFDDGSDIGGDSGQVTGDSGRVGGSGGGVAGRMGGQGGQDGQGDGKGPIKIVGNKAVAEHTEKYGDGYSFRAVDRAAEGSRRIIGEASAFADEDGRKVRAQQAPPVQYGTMKITPGNGQAAPGEN